VLKNLKQPKRNKVEQEEPSLNKLLMLDGPECGNCWDQGSDHRLENEREEKRTVEDVNSQDYAKKGYICWVVLEKAKHIMDLNRNIVVSCKLTKLVQSRYYRD